MDEVIKQARQLGTVIARDLRYIAFAKVREAVEVDGEAKKLVESLVSQIARIAELERNLKPVEPEDKRELERLQQAAAANPKLQEFMRVQADYVEMMRAVNGAIQGELEKSSGGGLSQEQSS